MAVAGVAASAWLISSETLLQLGASNQFRGRIFGTLGTTSALASLAGMLLAGSLTDLVGLVPILCISGSLYIISGMMAWSMLPKTQGSFKPDQPAIAGKGPYRFTSIGIFLTLLPPLGVNKWKHSSSRIGDREAYPQGRGWGWG